MVVIYMYCVQCIFNLCTYIKRHIFVDRFTDSWRDYCRPNLAIKYNIVLKQCQYLCVSKLGHISAAFRVSARWRMRDYG